MSNIRSKHAFGSLNDVDSAIKNGLIDAYDILFLKEGKIGWIDSDGNKVIVEDKKQVIMVDSLPATGCMEIVYICNGRIYFWDGSNFVPAVADVGSVWEDM